MGEIIHGDYNRYANEEILVQNEQFVFARSTERESALVMLILLDQPFSFDFSHRGKNYQSVISPCDSIILIIRGEINGEL